jgi:hypothetical protein
LAVSKRRANEPEVAVEAARKRLDRHFRHFTSLEFQPVEDVGATLPAARDTGSRLGEAASTSSVEEPSEAAQRRERPGSSGLSIRSDGEE